MVDSIYEKLSKIWAVCTNSYNTPNSMTTETSTDDPMDELSELFVVEQNRAIKYKDYDEMDDSYGGIFSSALDAYADTVTRRERLDDSLLVRSENKEVLKLITDFSYRLNLNNKLRDWARDIAKYGDLFIEPVYNGLGDLIWLKLLERDKIFVNPDVNSRKIYPYVQQDIGGTAEQRFLEWQIVHLNTKRNATDKYGSSSLHGSRPGFKPLQAMEQKLIVNMLERKTNVQHKINVSGLPPSEADKVVEKYKMEYKKKLSINPTTGNYDVKKNIFTSFQDFFIRFTGEKSTGSGVSLLESNPVLDIRDLEYIRECILSSLKVPKQLLNIEVGQGSRSSPVEHWRFFVASVTRIQVAIIEGLYKIFDIYLVSKGIDINDVDNNYELVMPEQPVQDELIAARIKLIESTAVKNYIETGILDKQYIRENMLNIPKDKLEEMLNRMEVESNTPDTSNTPEKPSSIKENIKVKPKTIFKDGFCKDDLIKNG